MRWYRIKPRCHCFAMISVTAFGQHRQPFIPSQQVSPRLFLSLSLHPPPSRRVVTFFLTFLFTLTDRLCSFGFYTRGLVGGTFVIKKHSWMPADSTSSPLGINKLFPCLCWPTLPVNSRSVTSLPHSNPLCIHSSIIRASLHRGDLKEGLLGSGPNLLYTR